MKRKAKILVSGFTLLFICLSTLSFYSLYQSPSLGINLQWDDKQRAWEVRSAKKWSPLKAGDVIREIDGLPITFHHLLLDNCYVDTRKELLSWFQAKEDIFNIFQKKELPITFLREGKAFHMEVAPFRTGFSFLSRPAFFQMIAAALFLLIGILVLSKESSKKESVALFLVCMSFMLTHLSTASSILAEIAYYPSYFAFMNTLNLVNYGITGALALYFTLLLPREREWLKKFSKGVWLFFIANAFMALSLDIPIMDIVVPASMCLSLAVLIHAFFVYRDPVERQQMKWVIAGFIFGVGPYVLVNGIPMLVTGQPLFSDNIPMMFLVFIPLFTGFAVHRHRLFDIDLLFEGTFVYAMTLGLIFTIDFGLANLLLGGLPESAEGNLISLLLAIAIYAPLRQQVARFVRKVFARSDVDQIHALESFSKEASGQAPDAVMQIFERIVRETFRPSRTLLLKGDRPETNQILKFIQGRKEFSESPIRLWEYSGRLPDPLTGMHLMLVMGTLGDVHHLVLIDGRSDGRFYSKHDLAVLEALRNQGQILYRNSRLYEENMHQTRLRYIQEMRYSKEKAGLLQDLHDGVGGIMTNIHLLAELAKTTCGDPDSLKRLAAISDLSEEGISEIRGFLYSLDGKGGTWESLVADLRHYGSNLLDANDISFESDISVQGMKTAPDGLLGLILFKIYREILNNVIKHARATSVSLALKIRPERLFLSLRDNGIGPGADHGNGRGLAGIRSRAEEIGGRLEIRKEGGTCVTLDLPLPISYEADEKVQGGKPDGWAIA